jgi:nucleoid-associated protein YgaU
VTRAEVASALVMLPKVQQKLAYLKPEPSLNDGDTLVRHRDPQHASKVVSQTVKHVQGEIFEAVGGMGQDVKSDVKTGVKELKSKKSKLKATLHHKVAKWKQRYEDFFKADEVEIPAVVANPILVSEAPLPVVKASPPVKAVVVETPAESDLERLPDLAPDVTEAAVAPDGEDLSYVIAPGDTLPRISKRFTGAYKNWQAIAEYNHLTIERVQTQKGEVLRCNIILGRAIKIPHSLLL